MVGSIPPTINNCSSIMVLDLGNNNLSGRIPKTLSQLQFLKSLHLNNNKILRELSPSLRDITSLDVLDLSYNKLSGIDSYLDWNNFCKSYNSELEVEYVF